MKAKFRLPRKIKKVYKKFCRIPYYGYSMNQYSWNSFRRRNCIMGGKRVNKKVYDVEGCTGKYSDRETMLKAFSELPIASINSHFRDKTWTPPKMNNVFMGCDVGKGTDEMVVHVFGVGIPERRIRGILYHPIDLKFDIINQSEKAFEDVKQSTESLIKSLIDIGAIFPPRLNIIKPIE